MTNDAWEANRPGRFSSGRVAMDPITGEPKKFRSEESIVEFAERHGWELRRMPDESEGYLEWWRFRKYIETVDVIFWKGVFPESFTQATVAHIDLPNRKGFPIRQRVERALVGMKCTCRYKDGLLPYEQNPDPSCVIHGRDAEAPEVAEVRSINVEQAQQEQMSL